MKILRLSLAALAFLPTVPALADVKESADDRLVIESVVTAARPPDEMYRILAKPGLWWDSAHTYSGSAANLKIDARAGGCFCEKVGRGTVEHGRVIFTDPGKLLRIHGALGPLQEMAVTGVLTFKLEPDAAGSRITMTYRVSGAFSMSGDRLAPAIDQVMAGQLQRLAAAADRSNR
jgi:hypothetical protein